MFQLSANIPPAGSERRDPVYTGKAMAALFDLVRRGRFKTGDQVVFWHTGGAPGLFAYRDVF